MNSREHKIIFRGSCSREHPSKQRSDLALLCPDAISSERESWTGVLSGQLRGAHAPYGPQDVSGIEPVMEEFFADDFNLLAE